MKQLEVNIQNLKAETMLKIPLLLILKLIIMVLNVQLLYMLLSQTLQT